MNRGKAFGVAASAAAIATLAGCVSQGGTGQSTSSSPPPGTERMTTQVKAADGSTIGNATFDFANGYATVTVETGPNQVLSPGFHGLMVHAVGKCEPNSTAPGGDSTGEFASAGSVYQAPDHTGSPASGDLTALQVRPDGSAKLVTTTSLLTAADLRNNLGTSLIVHQDADNLSPNSAGGSSGKRIACGVIAAGSATTSSSTTTTSVSTVTTTVEVTPPTTSTSTVTVTSVPTTTYMPTTTVTTTYLPPGR